MTKHQTYMCKGLAIFMIFFHHLFSLEEQYGGYNVVFAPLSENFVVTLARICKVGVAMFVFLTGYGYTKSHNSKNEEYDVVTCRRYFRLMFGFWFVFILAMSSSFLGRNPLDVYGRRIPEFFLNLFFDMLGISTIMRTPEFNVTWWYMSYAVLLVFVTPFFIKVTKSLKTAIVPITILLPRFLTENLQRAFWWYLLSLILGIYFAEFEILEKMERLHIIKKIVVLITGWLISIIVAILRMRVGFYDIFDAYLAVTICVTIFCVLSRIPIINKVLYFAGKHSMNMFLTHTLIKGYYFTDFIYSFKNFLMIFSALVITTLFLSICIEQIKKWIKYNRIECLCCKKVLHLIKNGEKR